MADSSSFRRHTNGKIAQRSDWRPSLIVPGAVPVYNVSILRNRFKGSVFPGRQTNRFQGPVLDEGSEGRLRRRNFQGNAHGEKE